MRLRIFIHFLESFQLLFVMIKNKLGGHTMNFLVNMSIHGMPVQQGRLVSLQKKRGVI